MKKTILVLAALSLVSSSAFAADAKKKTAIAPTKSFARNYGMAGCGLGSIVVGKDGPQILAATTNGTAYNQTFGITLEASNCIDSASANVASKVDNFVVANKVALAGDIARGDGEALSSLSSMLNCSNNANLGSTLQSNFSRIFPSYDVSANTVTDSIITVIETDAVLSQNCRLI